MADSAAKTEDTTKPKRKPRQEDPADHPLVQACIALRSALQSEPRGPFLEGAYQEFNRQLCAVTGEVVPRHAGDEHPDYRKADGTVDTDLMGEHAGSDVDEVEE